MTDMAYKALALAGCDMDEFDSDNPRLSEQMLIDATQYLENTLKAKYPGVAFELTACIRHGVDLSYDEFRFTAAGDAGSAVIARVHMAEDGSFRCTDGYYGMAKAAEFDALIQSLLAGVEPRAVCFSTLNAQLDEAVTMDTPLKELLKRRAFMTYAWILLPPGAAAFDDRVAAIREALSAAKVAGDFSVYLLTDQGAAAGMSRAEALERIPADQDAHMIWSESTRFIEG